MHCSTGHWVPSMVAGHFVRCIASGHVAAGLRTETMPGCWKAAIETHLRLLCMCCCLAPLAGPGAGIYEQLYDMFRPECPVLKPAVRIFLPMMIQQRLFVSQTSTLPGSSCWPSAVPAVGQQS